MFDLSALSSVFLGRYLLVGLFNTAVSYALYCALLYVGIAYPLATLGSLLGGIFLSFVTLGRYVFVSRLRGRFPRFLTVWCGLYLLNIGLLNVLIKLGFDPYIAGIVAAPPTIGLAFLLQRFVVFPPATATPGTEDASVNVEDELRTVGSLPRRPDPVAVQPERRQSRFQQ